MYVYGFRRKYEFDEQLLLFQLLPESCFFLKIFPTTQKFISCPRTDEWVPGT